MELVWSSPHPLSTSSPSSSILLFQVRTFVESHDIHFIEMNCLLQWTSVWLVRSLLSFLWRLLTLTYGFFSWPICDDSECISNIIIGQCLHLFADTREYLSILCALTMRHFWEELYWDSAMLTQPPPSSRLTWTIPSWWEHLGPVTRVYGNLSGRYPDSEGLGLIKLTCFNLLRDAVSGNSWVTMKCKWDWSYSSIRSCEFPGFGTSSASSQLLICKSSWALGLAWGWLPCRDQFLKMLLWHS